MLLLIAFSFFFLSELYIIRSYDLRTYPRLWWCKDEKHDDVNQLDDTSNRIDSDQKDRVCFDEGIKDPEHGTEKCNHIWHRLKI